MAGECEIKNFIRLQFFTCYHVVEIDWCDLFVSVLEIHFTDYGDDDNDLRKYLSYELKHSKIDTLSIIFLILIKKLINLLRLQLASEQLLPT